MSIIQIYYKSNVSSVVTLAQHVKGTQIIAQAVQVAFSLRILHVWQIARKIHWWRMESVFLLARSIH